VKRYLNFTSLFVALLLTAYIGLTAFKLPVPPKQDGGTSQYFDQTGHNVGYPFYAYFLRTGGVMQYGYPITDEYVDPDTHLLVQYFQKARLEWHPGNADPYKVQLGLLGSELGKQTAPIPISQMPPQNDPNCLYFPDTGHSTCFVFRNYWLTQGGLDRFGYPISEFVTENGMLVQYFQRARMEWHPEKLAGQRIQLAPLGSIYYAAAGFDATRLAPVGAQGHLGVVTTLQARASVFKSTARANDSQTSFVFVTDQFGRPLGGVAVTLIVYFKQGPQTFVLPPTNAGGTSFQSFALSKGTPGELVTMGYILSYPGLGDSLTRTSCMIWY
jgi:hypothetical protein